MTLEIKPYKELEKYFFRIVNTKPEELTMFEYLKERFTSLWTKPVTFVEEQKETHFDEDYWAFEMVSNEWTDWDGEKHPLKHSVVTESHDGTWMEVLDRILDEMGKHYGYNIKEQVYYSTMCPLNEIDDRTGKPFAGYGRSLNDEVLQQLLLAFPEVYNTVSFPESTTNVFE